MGSCKDDDDKTPEPDPDFTTEFVGNYATKTADSVSATNHLWEVTAKAKNQLGILYTKNITVTISGLEQTGFQKYTLINVVPSSKDAFTINEVVDVEQSNGKPLKQKVEGIATKVTNSAGKAQLNITVKLTNAANSAATEEYLEFKKQ